jgi:hypothetical protein
LHLPALLATGIALCIVLGLTSSAQSQSPPACPYVNGLPSVVCDPNPTPDTIPAGIPGNLLTSAECTNVQIDAIASMHSYDDVSCYSVGTLLPHFSKLKFVRDGADILPDNWKRINEAKDFRAALYCDISTNTLILAFRGSISLTAMSRNDIYDWYFTNFAQHMGDRPLQYQGAEDAAQLVKRELGNYSDVCGPGSQDYF